MGHAVTKLTVGDCITAAWLTLADRPQDATTLLVKVRGKPLTDCEIKLHRAYCGWLAVMNVPSWAEDIARSRMEVEGL